MSKRSPFERYYQVTYSDGTRSVLLALSHRQAAALASKEHPRLRVTRVKQL